jgi:hypothetical protein
LEQDKFAGQILPIKARSPFNILWENRDLPKIYFIRTAIIFTIFVIAYIVVTSYAIILMKDVFFSRAFLYNFEDQC